MVVSVAAQVLESQAKAVVETEVVVAALVMAAAAAEAEIGQDLRSRQAQVTDPVVRANRSLQPFLLVLAMASAPGSRRTAIAPPSRPNASFFSEIGALAAEGVTKCR